MRVGSPTTPTVKVSSSRVSDVSDPVDTACTDRASFGPPLLSSVVVPVVEALPSCAASTSGTSGGIPGIVSVAPGIVVVEVPMRHAARQTGCVADPPGASGAADRPGVQQRGDVDVGEPRAVRAGVVGWRCLCHGRDRHGDVGHRVVDVRGSRQRPRVGLGVHDRLAVGHVQPGEVACGDVGTEHQDVALRVGGVRRRHRVGVGGEHGQSRSVPSSTIVVVSSAGRTRRRVIGFLPLYGSARAAPETSGIIVTYRMQPREAFGRVVQSGWAQCRRAVRAGASWTLSACRPIDCAVRQKSA